MIAVGTRTYQNYIDGTWVDARNGATSENRNTADPSDLSGLFPRSIAEDTAAAVEAAHAALPGWAALSPLKCSEILLRAAEVAADMTCEEGKTGV